MTIAVEEGRHRKVLNLFLTIGAAILETALVTFPLAVLIIVAAPQFSGITKLTLILVVLLTFFLRAKLSSLVVRQEAANVRVLFGLSFVGLILVVSILTSLHLAAALALFAMLAWVLQILVSPMSERGFFGFRSPLLSDLRLSGSIERLTKQFEFSGGSFQVHSALQNARTIYQIDAVVIFALLVLVSIWPAAPSALAVMVFAAAAVSIWTHIEAVKGASQSQLVAKPFKATGNLTYSCCEGSDFSSLALTQVGTDTTLPLDLEIYGGLCLAFVGSGSSGKSQFLRDLVEGSAFGHITFNDSSRVPPKTVENLFSYCAPDDLWIPDTLMSALESGGGRGQKALEILWQLDPYRDAFEGIDDYNNYFSRLAPLQGKLISLARCIGSSAPVLVLNKPEMHLDQVSKAALAAVVLKSKMDGRIIIMATDDDLMMSLADELLIFERGEVVDRGPALELRDRHRNKFLRGVFRASSEDAYRMSMWLDTLMPSDISDDLSKRVQACAEELLLRAPRDAFASKKPIYVNAKLGAKTCRLTLQDCGDFIGLKAGTVRQSGTAFDPIGVLPVNHQIADHIAESQRHGMRQISVVLEERKPHQSYDSAAAIAGVSV